MHQISFKLEVFEGPLDLLLHLIHKNKVSLYDIPIVEITEQYNAYIEETEYFDIEAASEFLVVAANLLYIKSKMLLPKYNDEKEEEDPRTELVQRLIEYKRFKEAANYLNEHQFAGVNLFYKTREYIEPILIDESLVNITKEHLATALLDVAERVENRKPPTSKNFKGIVGREIVSVFSKVKSIISRLNLLKRIRFEDIFRGSKSKSEVVASFLAILELIKMNRVRFSENKNGREIKLTGSGEMNLNLGDTED